MIKICFFFCAVLLHLGNGASDLVVQIRDGKVQGSIIANPDGTTFYSWRGIPFAKPPLGELRFLAPEKVEPWDGVLDASESGPACIYASSFPGDPTPSKGNSEDCLTISVYSPVNANNSESLPVLFWIYGGGFSSGNSDFNFYDPSPFLQENVIVVSFNYRLAVFGFLSTEDSVISGNAGLKDQLLALEWTRDNVGSFGGDPNRITIFGESAGAMSVGYHLVSRKSRDLFSAAIMQSGSALCFFNISDPRPTAYSLAQTFSSNVTTSSDSSDIKKILDGVSADELVTAAAEYSFGPVLEEQSEESFMYEPRYELLEAGDNAKVPVIVGHNSEESLPFFLDEDGVKQSAQLLDADPIQILPFINLNDEADRDQIAQEIKEQYIGKGGKFEDDLAAVVNWKSDNMFLRSSYKDVILQSAYVSVYMYQFSFYGSKSENRFVIPGAGKVGHADELAYLFNITTFPLKTEADFLTRNRMVKLWTNFAKTYDPTPEDDSLLQNVKWNTVKPDNVQFLDIGDDLVMKPSRKLELTVFWDYLWKKYAHHPYYTF